MALNDINKIRGTGEKSLFFLRLPDLRKLCCITLSCQNIADEGELRNGQLKTCRELVSLYADIIVSPVLGSFGGITVIMDITFFKSGITQAYAQRHSLQASSPQRVLPSTLQTCLSYTLTVRLAPNWNKAGQFLIAGMDFLSDSGKLNAVVMELNTSESQLCVSVEASTVRCPPARLEDFELPALVVRNFLSKMDAVIHLTVPNNWCYILPSMKRGQIISLSHRIPLECPFRSYAELQEHWTSMYGYRLPAENEEDVIYCSVYFRAVGERLFTYPLTCIRLQPVQCFPRVDLQGALGAFVSDLRGQLRSVGSIPVRLTSKPLYHTNDLNKPSSQVSGNHPVNLTTKTSSRPVLSWFPSICPQRGLPQCSLSQSGTQRNSQPSSASGRYWDALAVPPTSESALWQGSERGWPQSASISSIASSSSSSISASHHLPCQTQPAARGPKLVPTFKNKTPQRYVNVNVPQKQKTRGERPSRSATASGMKRPPSSSLSQPSFQSRQPAFSPTFCHPSQGRVPWPLSQGHQGHNASLVTPREPSRHVQPVHPADVPSNRGGEVFESKPKRPKSKVQEVDVETYARNHQLAKVNTATLQMWLRSRGVSVCSKDRKEGLVSKVMQCLAEP